ncbi:MAG: hypothetical protein FD167_4835, partial [bacterium]
MNMKKIKTQKLVFFSMLLAVLLLLTSTSTTNTNHAKLINPTKDLAYIFKISDKLEGTGEMVLTLNKNKIKGTASGVGIACKRDINFLTNIEGTINYLNGDINVTVTGTGDPQGVIPLGKVVYQGPLKGSFVGSKIRLVGKVDIKGTVARYAGFKDKEDILIEIPYLVERS